MDDQTPKYPHNALEGFANGCLLDLRVRFAMQLLNTSQLYAGVTISSALTQPVDIAKHALDVATALLAEAERRGLVTPITDDGELSPEVRAQARRTASFGVLQQMEGQKFAQRESDQVIPAAPRVVNPRH